MMQKKHCFCLRNLLYAISFLLIAFSQIFLILRTEFNQLKI